MSLATCPTCGCDLAAVDCLCPKCGQLLNESKRMCYPLPPEVLERAKREFSEEEILAGIEEIERTGGLELCEFIYELEAIVRP